MQKMRASGEHKGTYCMLSVVNERGFMVSIQQIIAVLICRTRGEMAMKRSIIIPDHKQGNGNVIRRVHKSAT